MIGNFGWGLLVAAQVLLDNVEPELLERVSQALTRLISEGLVESGFPLGSWIVFN